MSEVGVTATPAAEAAQAAGPLQGLHPASFLFLVGKAFKHLALPLVAALFLGREAKHWQLLALTPMLIAMGFAFVRARAFRYQVGDGELVVREGVLDRTLRHIPFGRIQHISQRRQLAHRLLGVVELRLESASGGKPEAVMKVLSLQQAQALEALLHEHGAGAADLAPGSAQPVAEPSAAQLAERAAATTTAPAADPAAAVLLHQLSAAEIFRLGLASNRGMVIVGVAMGAVMGNDTARKLVIPYFRLPFHWLRDLLHTEAAGHNWLGLALGTAMAVLALLVLMRLLSVVLAFFKYNGFMLQLQGSKLVATFGLSTHVRASARLARLQRWQLDESLVHRLLGRCRLSVAVAGGSADRGHGLEPGAHLDELAPIGTPAQARALLRISLPALDWDALQWQPLPKAGKRRMAVQARFLLPLTIGLLWGVSRQQDPMLPWGFWLGLVALLAALWVWHARAWGRFAAYAQEGEVLVHRTGVLHRRWVIVAMPRLQSLRLATTPLDRSLGVCSLQADTQGGSRKRRALDMACLPLAQAEGLRAGIWQRMLKS